MKNEDEFNEKMVDKEQKDNLDTMKQDDHQDKGDKGDDHAGVKEPGEEPADGPPEVADIVLALDLTGSFGGAGLATVQNPNFLADLDATLAAGGATDVGYGIASFVDYPADPYTTNLAVTQDLPTAQGVLGGLAAGGGGDEAEAQLVALQQVGLQADGEIGYRDDPEVERFVVLTTDAPFHVSGDVGGEYPEIAQVADALVAGNVTPIFAVTQEEFDANTYQNLITQLNAVDDSIGGTVVPLLPDSSNLGEAILAGLEASTADMLLA